MRSILTIMYNACILIFVTLLKVFATSGSRVITGPKYKERHEGSDVKLMWNSTRGLKSATFGISKNGLPNPQFINVNTLTGKVNTNNETAKTFAGRVFFIGNLTAGHAWFLIRNLEINDTNEYIARISVGGSTTKSYVVRLTVQSSSDKVQKVIMECKILGPSNLHSCVGCAVIFKYITVDGNKIYSAKWGIRKGNIPEPKFIYIDVRHNTPIINEDYRSKVAFVGNLTAGRAWFILKNLTINDTNEYIAVIRDDASGPNPYPVNLEVRNKMDIFSTFPTTLLLPTQSTTTSPTTTEPKVTKQNPTKVTNHDRIIAIVFGSPGLVLAICIIVSIVKVKEKKLCFSKQRDTIPQEVTKENKESNLYESQLYEESQQESKRQVSSIPLIV